MTGYPTKRWWFVLGREPAISRAEIRAVFEVKDEKFFPPILIAATGLDPKTAVRELGGTVKIAEDVGELKNETDLLERVASDLTDIGGKIIFGLSWYGGDASAVQSWGKNIKDRLRSAGRSARHVFNREAFLSSVSVEKNGLIRRGREYIVIRDGGRFRLARTRAVQPFASYSARDYGRPGRDDVSGMLPPKLALMMLNIARIKKDTPLLDPFCGSGTILSEAKLLGFTRLYGSDVSKKAIADTKKNLDWLKTLLAGRPEGAITLFTCDVENLSDQLTDQVGAIVTEPSLGPPLTGREGGGALNKNAAALAALYQNAFQQFKKILTPPGTVVFVFPRFKFKSSWVSVADRAVPLIKKLGFRPVPLSADSPSLFYHRPRQRVGREIWKFTR